MPATNGTINQRSKQALLRMRKGQTMKKKSTGLRTYLYLTSAAILLAGVVSAVLVYRAALDEPNDEAGYEVVGGFIYPGATDYSKKYVHDLQLYGGQAAVLSDRFMRWFSGLWHGRSLAYTIACIAVFLSFVIFVVAQNLPSGLKANLPREDNGDGAG
jgi:hypothetical protein